ncbi:NAD(P)-dependent oxidoreductase [Paenibacillus agricola]|uniref:NAD(P)-dependent oxidoreductase n=1 Tax=Paenibacillus agricola TaxID=2716264 RepID=A0ABX0JBT9_9BACL|nr:NAD(P)-dependent oxidoreductase [Paenibacillus agricola]NHN33617.1 NAD(P)-dependent oxidoreductase [Paenibacillus agricola]
MKIAIIGASGKAGSLISQEAISRGHQVTAIVRDAAKIVESSVSVLEKDILKLTAEDLTAFDAVVNAFGAPQGQEQQHVEAGNVLIEALKNSSTRLVVVGGAGSLFVDPDKTTRLMDTPQFPAAYFPTASNQGENLNILQQTDSLSWTFISPAIAFTPGGARTGSYQQGKDHLLMNAKGESYISYADYAIAVIDELERPKHINERFTVVAETE